MNETINVLMKRKSVRVYEDREIPQEAKDVLEAAYLKACETDAAKTFATEKGVVLEALNLEESNQLRDETASMVGWILYDSGVATVSPEEFGIERP